MIVWDDWLLTPARAALHVPSGTAVVADLHLGYGESRRRSGEAVPLPSVEEILSPLRAILDGHGIRSLVIAGDLFEAGPDAEIIERLLVWLKDAGVEKFRAVPGNHDRGLKHVPQVLRPPEGPVHLGEWQIVHGDGKLPPGAVVQGHHHPGLWLGRGLSTAPCFLARAGHLVLPAYSAEAAGGDVRHQPRWRGYRCVAAAAGQTVDLGEL